MQEGLAPGFLISGPVSFLIPVPCHHLDVVGSVVHLVPYETLSVTIHVIFLSPWKTGSTPVGDAERPPGKPEPELRHRLRSQDSLPGSSLHLRTAPSSAHRCHHTRGGRVLPVPTHLAGGHLLCSAEEHSRGCQGKANAPSVSTCKRDTEQVLATPENAAPWEALRLPAQKGLASSPSRKPLPS